jgi:hypothetical protein
MLNENKCSQLLSLSQRAIKFQLNPFSLFTLIFLYSVRLNKRERRAHGYTGCARCNVFDNVFWAIKHCARPDVLVLYASSFSLYALTHFFHSNVPHYPLHACIMKNEWINKYNNFILMIPESYLYTRRVSSAADAVDSWWRGGREKKYSLQSIDRPCDVCESMVWVKNSDRKIEKFVLEFFLLLKLCLFGVFNLS